MQKHRVFCLPLNANTTNRASHAPIINAISSRERDCSAVHTTCGSRTCIFSMPWEASSCHDSSPKQTCIYMTFRYATGQSNLINSEAHAPRILHSGHVPPLCNNSPPVPFWHSTTAFVAWLPVIQWRVGVLSHAVFVRIDTRLILFSASE
jgi:hypothetical protein